jgi:hypothetical protein
MMFKNSASAGRADSSEKKDEGINNFERPLINLLDEFKKKRQETEDDKMLTMLCPSILDH